MSSKAEFFAILGSTLTAIGLICAYLLPAWKARRIAKAAEREAAAAERKAFAEITSDRMKDALRVLVGEPGNPDQGLAERQGLGKRMSAVEAQLKNNGGNSLRDVLDRVHDIAVQNGEANERVEQQLRDAAAVAGDAAMQAANADQRVRELADETRLRHLENVQRLDRLEENAEGASILREFLLKTLRDKHAIDLLPDEDDG